VATDWTKAELNGIVERIFMRAIVDRDYRNQCLKDAKTMIEQVAEKPLPTGGAIPVFVETFEAKVGYHVIELPDFCDDGAAPDQDAVLEALESYGKSTDGPVQPCLGTPLTVAL